MLLLVCVTFQFLLSDILTLRARYQQLLGLSVFSSAEFEAHECFVQDLFWGRVGGLGVFPGKF